MKRIWHELPVGMTITTHDKNGYVYLTMRAANIAQTVTKTRAFNAGNYLEVYDELLDWLTVQRGGDVDAVYDPPSFATVMRRLGLKQSRVVTHRFSRRGSV